MIREFSLVRENITKNLNSLIKNWIWLNFIQLFHFFLSLTISWRQPAAGKLSEDEAVVKRAEYQTLCLFIPVEFTSLQPKNIRETTIHYLNFYFGFGTQFMDSYRYSYADKSEWNLGNLAFSIRASRHFFRPFHPAPNCSFSFTVAMAAVPLDDTSYGHSTEPFLIGWLVRVALWFTMATMATLRLTLRPKITIIPSKPMIAIMWRHCKPTGNTKRKEKWVNKHQVIVKFTWSPA